jgi:hypothetical protein
MPRRLRATRIQLPPPSPPSWTTAKRHGSWSGGALGACGDCEGLVLSGIPLPSQDVAFEAGTSTCGSCMKLLAAPFLAPPLLPPATHPPLPQAVEALEAFMSATVDLAPASPPQPCRSLPRGGPPSPESLWARVDRRCRGALCRERDRVRDLEGLVRYFGLVCLCVCVLVCICVCACVCVLVCVHMCVCVCACVYSVCVL